MFVECGFALVLFLKKNKLCGHFWENVILKAVYVALKRKVLFCHHRGVKLTLLRAKGTYTTNMGSLTRSYNSLPSA